MAISIDWGTYTIHVPRNDMIVVQTTPVEIRQLNIDDFRKALNDLQDDPEGMPFPTTHNHVAPISVGGVDLARVVEILPPYTITFEDGQYAVNLVGANSNIGDRTNVNQVSIRSANSAGLPDLTAIQSGSFNGAVHVNALSIYNGTTYPVGTASYPVNNIPDARAIAIAQGLTTIMIAGSYTLDVGDDVSGLKLIGSNPMTSFLTINPGADTLNTQISDMQLTGTLDGGTLIERCILTDLNYISGVVFNSMLNPGTISLGSAFPAFFLSCYSGVPGTDTPTIDMNGTTNEDTPLVIRDYSGGIKLIDKNGPGKCSIDMSSGQVKIDPSCISGEIVVRGLAKVINATTGTYMCNGTYNGGLTLINETVNGIQTHDMWRDMGLDPNSPSGKVLASIMKEEVWNATAIDFNDSGSMGEKLNAAGTAGDPWTTSLAGYTTPGTAGHTIRTKLNLDVKAVADIVASKDTFKSWQGKILYVKPTTGSDTTGDGSRDLPFKTITKALTLVTDHGHDLIYILADVSGARTTINEQVNINKSDVMIRGPGRDVLWTSPTPGDTITINGVHGVEISGFEIQTAVTGVGSCINVTNARSYHVHDNLFTYARASAVRVVGDSSFGMIERNVIHGTGKNAAASAIEIDATSNTIEHTIVEWNTIAESTGDGITTKNSKCEDSIIRNNSIIGCTGVGINVQSGTRTSVYDNKLTANTAGNIVNTGTASNIQNNQQWSTLTSTDIPTITAIADEVRVELSPELAHLLTLQNGQGLDSTQATMLLEIYRLYGLDPTRPLVVGPTYRSTGAEIAQTISELAGVVTVTRQ